MASYAWNQTFTLHRYSRFRIFKGAAGLKVGWAMRLYKYIIAMGAGALLLDGCNEASRHKEPAMIRARVGRFSLNVDRHNVIGFVENEPGFLRVRLNSHLDLVLDGRTERIHDQSFMSVTPTQFGLGVPIQLGDKEVWCPKAKTRLYFACADKFVLRSGQAIVVFDLPPRSEKEVDDAERLASYYLMSKSIMPLEPTIPRSSKPGTGHL